MDKKIGRWEIGPIFAVLSIAYGMITSAMSRHIYPAFQIDFVSHRFLFIFGIALLLIGVPLFIISVKTVHRAYNSDSLITSGVFRCRRHPLYSSWVVFIVPGFMLIFKSWIMLTTPIFMYLILRLLVKNEESYLEHLFGAEYLDYKNRVPCILPFGFLFNKAD